MTELITNVGVPVAAALIAGFVTYVTVRIQHRGKPENALIDQMRKQLDRVETRMARFEARDQVYIPHIIRLNRHIELQLGPPAPKIPKVILDYLEADEDEPEN